MKILTPDADEVFTKWLSNADSKKIKKSFGIDKNAITASESVKEVEKSAFLYFYSRVDSKSIKEEGGKSDKVPTAKLKDITFYSFSSDGVDRNAWKKRIDFVPTLKNLKEVRCKICDGKGSEECNYCHNSRFIQCDACKGKDIKCDACKGSGKYTVSVEVKELNKKGDEKTRKIEKTTQCPSCLGLGKINCQKCGGTGKIVCYNCKGNPIACQECNGHGIFFEVYNSPVPLIITPGKIFHPFMVKKDEWMLKDRDYNQKLESAESYPIHDVDKLNEKVFKEFFGVLSLDKDLKRCIEEAKKTYNDMTKEYDKGKAVKRPLKPIFLVFLLRLLVTTPKRKKFDVYALGTKNKFTIMTNQF